MRTPKGWEARAYPFTHVTEGTRTVEGVVHPCGFLGYHDNSTPGMALYIVDHLPTGAMICQVEKQTQAQELCSSLSDMESLRSTTPESSALSLALATVSTLQQRWTEERAAKPAPAPKQRQPATAGRSSFSPVFPNRNPSKPTRVAANQAALALGTLWDALPNGMSGPMAGEACPGSNGTSITALQNFYARLDQWHDVETREVLVVKLTQKPNQTLITSDIPPSLPMAAPRRQEGQQYFLRDGTLANAEQFKIEYQRLMEYGDRLQEGARRLLALYAASAPDWAGDSLARWQRIDAKFVSLVQEAWMVWSRCAYCFWASSPVFQKRVTDKIGYVGNAEQGWAELGRKTFLRHPELREVAPLRQEMKETR